KKEGVSFVQVPDPKGTDYLEKEYLYDGSFNLIQENRYGRDDNDLNKYLLSSTVDYSYDSQNREIKRCYVNVYHPVDNCILHKYNKNNLLKEKYRTYTKQRQKYKYEKGKLVELVYEEDFEEEFFKTEVNFRYE